MAGCPTFPSTVSIDKTRQVCVLWGVNETFCAGFDLYEDGPIIDKEHRIKKPVICAVSGYLRSSWRVPSFCYLGIFELLKKNAVFRVSYRRFRILLIDGRSVRLQAIVGLGRALDTILTGGSVLAQEALQIRSCKSRRTERTSIGGSHQDRKTATYLPRACMDVDRAGCYCSAYTATLFEDTLQNDVKGDAKFSNGAGRHGAFGKGIKPRHIVYAETTCKL
ncbi:hypothetical protein HD806DRAFT_552821 [Xylariaceae sp. AK1471]|nr:hypothetical protein HD806DRAFT_552821 [Xylariaceae sp. AK1471]